MKVDSNYNICANSEKICHITHLRESSDNRVSHLQERLEELDRGLYDHHNKERGKNSINDEEDMLRMYELKVDELNRLVLDLKDITVPVYGFYDVNGNFSCENLSKENQIHLENQILSDEPDWNFYITEDFSRVVIEEKSGLFSLTNLQLLELRIHQLSS